MGSTRRELIIGSTALAAGSVVTAPSLLPKFHSDHRLKRSRETPHDHSDDDIEYRAGGNRRASSAYGARAIRIEWRCSRHVCVLSPHSCKRDNCRVRVLATYPDCRKYLRIS